MGGGGELNWTLSPSPPPPQKKKKKKIYIYTYICEAHIIELLQYGISILADTDTNIEKRKENSIMCSGAVRLRLSPWQITNDVHKHYKECGENVDLSTLVIEDQKSSCSRL